MAPPVRRLVLLSRVEETLQVRGWPYPLACNEYPGTVHPEGHRLLRNFSSTPFPRWIYASGGWTLEKTVQLPHGQNSVVLTYTLLDGADAVEFELRPLMALRPIHELMYQWNGRLEAEAKSKRHHRIPPTQRTPEVFFAHDGAFEGEGTWYFNTIYRREQDRGYAGLEDLWSPGVIKWKLSAGQSVRFVCSADPIDFRAVVAAAEQQGIEQTRIAPAGDAVLATLTSAAEQFVVDVADEANAKVIGEITQFPWGSPSARDALISMPGILLVTGKYAKAKSLLETLAARVRCGLVPTHFAENGGEPLYDGADTSLWFVNALWQYVRYSGDESAGVKKLLDVCLSIIDNYRAGTDLGIVADHDGLLASREPGRGTSWMDAKVGDWVITPRCGRPVELNALWYNALCAAAQLCERLHDTRHGEELVELAARVKTAFNRRFWNEDEKYCFDVIEDHGPDPSVRPNQLLAISLPFPVLAIERHADVLEKCRGELLTPFGLRTLSPRNPSYQGRYCGNVVSRDRACHQGSVYPWLLGAWITANLRVAGRSQAACATALDAMRPCMDRMRGIGNGQLCELFDGDAPHRAGGAIASALAVGELLRVYVEEILDRGPKMTAPVIQAEAKAETPVKAATKG
jgi:predicted glycogen debranching enzyme